MPHKHFADFGTVGFAEVRQLEIKHGNARKQLVFAAEVADHQRRIDFGNRGNIADCCAFIPLVSKQFLRRGEDGRTGAV